MAITTGGMRTRTVKVTSSAIIITLTIPAS
jgi:hypothetical protein